MNRIFTKLFFLTLFLIGSSLAHASFEFIGMQARYQAMGGTSAAYVNDSGGVMTNPAGLALSPQFHTAIDYSTLFGIKELGTTIASIQIPIRSHHVGMGLQSFGNTLYQEHIIALAYARHISSNFVYGVAARYYHLAIDKYGSAGTVGIDVGIIARIHPLLNWGVFSHNINKARIGQQHEAVPQLLSMGLFSHPIESLSLSAEVVKDLNFPVSTRLGVEFQWFRRLFLRAGFIMQPDFITFGSGFHFDKLQIAYAGKYHNELGLSHQFSVCFTFNPPPKPLAVTIEVIEPPAKKIKPNMPVNINAASASQLQQLNGIGPSLARRIVEYRQLNGPFRELADLKKVKGIGDRLIEQNKHRMVIE